MNWEEYIKFTRSVVKYERKNEKDYLKIGLLGEVGEFTGKIGKIFRDCPQGADPFIDDKLADQLLSELGDILWFIARLDDHFNIILTNVIARNDPYPKFKSRSSDAKDWVYILCYDLMDFAMKAVEEPIGYMDYFISYLRVTIGRFNDKIENNDKKLSFKKAIKENVEKLTDRNERGVINGCGDER